MKTIYSLLLCLILSTISFGQNFTNGSVYNFDIGDTIVYQKFDYIYGFSSQVPPKTYYKVYTGKTVDASGDIIYSGLLTEVTISVYPSYNLAANTSTFEESVVDLNSSAVAATLQGLPCQTVVTLTSLNCGQNQLEKRLQTISSCFEPPMLQHTYIEGVGFFYLQRSLNSYPFPGMGTETRLVNFHKKNGKCGIIGKIPTGISNISPTPSKISFFPNPARDIIEIDLNDEANLRIYSATGILVKTVYLDPGKQTLKVSDLATGIYTFHIIGKKQTAVSKLVISE